MALRDLLYGNPLSATALTLAEAMVHGRRYGTPASPARPTDERAATALTELARDGIAIVPDFFDPDTCRDLRTAMDEMLESQVERAWVDPEGADHRLFGFDRVNEHAQEFFSDPWIHDVGQQYTGCALVNLFTLAGRITPTENNRGSGGGWHRDSFARQFKSIIYLSDVDETNGPFEFVTGTTRLKTVIRDLWRGLHFRQTRIDEATATRLIARDPDQKRTITGSAGTLVLADTRGIHRGMPITSGSRYALTNYYFARPDVDEERIAHFNDHVPFADGETLTLERALAFEPRERRPNPVEA